MPNQILEDWNPHRRLEYLKVLISQGTVVLGKNVRLFRFFRMGARSNPATNSKKPGHRIRDRNAKEKELDTTQERRPVNDHIDARVGVLGMDSI